MPKKEAPKWVKRAGEEAVWAWNNRTDWRADAEQADTKSEQRRLVREARKAYYE